MPSGGRSRRVPGDLPCDAFHSATTRLLVLPHPGHAGAVVLCPLVRLIGRSTWLFVIVLMRG